MKITPVYRNKILSLPAEIISEKLVAATKEELQVLLAVYTEQEFEPSILASKLEMTLNVFNRALEAWRDSGIILIDGEEYHQKNDSAVNCEVQRKTVGVTAVARYTSGELASVVERLEGCTELIDSCQQILGKVFNSNETTIVVVLYDQLSLSPEYILRL